MSAPGLRDLSREDLLQLLRQPNLSAAHAFLKGRPDISLAAVAVNLDRMLNEVPLSRRLRDQQELLARMVRQAIRTDLDSAYAGLADAKPGERSGWEWNSLAVLYLNVESGDVAKSLLKEYPEISGEMVRVLGEMALKTAEGEEADRLRQRLELLDHWSQATLMWAMQEAQQSEKRLEEEPTMENLRAVAERVRDVATNPEFAKMPPETRAPVWERSAQMQYSVFLNVHDAAFLERAIEDGRTAWQMGNRSVLELLTGALVERYEIGGRQEDLDDTIGILSPIAADLKPENAPLLTTLANALRHRVMLRDGREDLDRAVQLYEWLAGLPVEEAARRDIRLLNLASGLMTRYDRVADLGDLDRAIEIWEDVSARISDRNPVKTTLYNNLGLALLKRFRDGDLDRAQAALAQSVNLLPEGSPELPRNLSNAGMGWLAAYQKSKVPEMLDAAIGSFTQIVGLLSARQSESARAFTLLSDALLMRFNLAGDTSDLEEAFRYAERAAAEATTGPFRLAAQFRQAVVLRTRGEREGNQADLDRAGELHKAAMAKALDEAPLEALEYGLSWGMQAYSREDWREAADALWLALDANDRVLESQKETGFKEERLKRVQGLGAIAARAFIDTGQIERAAAVAERGRAALVAHAIGARKSEAGGEHAAARAEGPIVYLENIDRGFALILTRGSVRALELPALNERVINQWLRENFAFRITNPPRYADALDEICRVLWDAAMGPLLEAVAGTRQVTLIPGGLLGMLPLHAAWREDRSRPTGRFYATDAVSFRYAPNAAVLGRKRVTAADSLLCVDEPLPVAAGPLPFSAEEVALARAHFDRSEVLKGEKATREAALKRIPRFSALHLSCHGFANVREPHKNGFAMANGEFLTLDDLLGLRLDAVELAFLSACDAGQIGSQLPDEAIGLPSGMLQSGAGAVISPLWPVTSWSTVLLIARFYELWRADKRAAADALREAQIWLRDTTNADKTAHFRDRPALYRYLLTREPNEREQRSIYAWAPFYYCGA